jgi:putative hydrolase of the HAD superfamily
LPEEDATRPGLPRRVRAVLLDALGTLLELQPPVPALRDELAARGLEVDDDEAGAALLAEITYYRAHHLEGGDRAGVARLRRRCAEEMRAALPERVRDVLTLDELEAAMLAALRFAPYPEVPDALAKLRRRGMRLVVVSNWDVSLHDQLARDGLDRLVHGVVSSAELGAAKPAPGAFRHALTLAGVPAADTVHDGDRVEEDVEGARAAGIAPVLVVRDGAPPALEEPVWTIRSLRELEHLGP